MSTKKRSIAPTPNAASGKENKKPRKAVTAKSLGLSKEEFDSIKIPPIRKKLKAICKTLAKQVDADWHDGYEEQAETKGEWFEAIESPLQAVLDVGVGKATALVQCNEVLKTVADSFFDLLANPCRCDTETDLSEMDAEITLSLPWGGEVSIASSEPVEAWRYVWVALLRVHAGMKGVDEQALLQCIKDASDNTTRGDLDLSGALYDDRTGEDVETEGKDAPEGSSLSKIMSDKKSAWKSLPNNVKNYKMRRAIDRRFDGPRNRRTRDYGGGRGDCTIM